MKGATVAYEMMRRNNVEYVFGNSGGPVLRIFDAIHKSESIQYIVHRNEQGAGFMAEGYARAR
jgi:acetolactate synthase-1/2/3 large subunit